MPDPSNTKISIINKSLAHIKIRSIMSLHEASEPARKANLFYDCVRKSMLRACDWKFATVKKALNLLGDVETAALNPTDGSKQDILPGWSYTYAYPAKCVRVRKLFNPQRNFDPSPYNDRSMGDNSRRQVQFEEARSPVTNVLCLGTNIPSAWAEFTYDITDESQFDDMFQDVMSWNLAAELAIPLSCDKELAVMVANEAKSRESEAKRKNGGEGTEMAPRVSNYESARTGYSEPY